MESQLPKISVIMPVYNGELYIKDAIGSILEQSFSDFEFIIINDGSNDKTEEIVKSYKDLRIVYTKNAKNEGLIACLNRGLSLAKGEYVARMDHDDLSLPDRFRDQVLFLDNNPSVAVVSGKLTLIDETGSDLGYWNDDFETTTEQEILERMPKVNCIGHPTVMMRRSVVSRYGYNRSYKNSEDWGLWLTLLSNGERIAKIDKILLQYRIHGSGTTVLANKENVNRKIIRFKRHYLKCKLSTSNFKKLDRKVFRSLMVDVLKYYLPFLYKFLVKLSATRFLSLFSQWKQFKKIVNDRRFDHHSIFFFPFYHLGGAEKVHTEIVEAADFTKPLVVFTSGSSTDTLLPVFQKYASTVQINELLIWPFFKRRVVKILLRTLKRDPAIKLFGCNSHFYYEFLRDLPENVVAIDLLHAFMHKHEDSPEKWSLPVVEKLNTRIVITNKTAEDFKLQYQENNLNPHLLQRVRFISNFVDMCGKPDKVFDGKLKILYVGRSTPEKRVPLLASIAKELHHEKINVEFHFAGDVQSVISADCLEFCVLHGEIRDSAALENLYARSHVLAMASTREGFPMVIMEGMMHGCVPVTTNVGGISQHIRNGENGILIEETGPELFKQHFVQEIKTLIASTEKLKFMSESAYSYALANFGPSQFYKSYKKLFTDGL